MKWRNRIISTIAGSAAGCVNGIFGAGGGMILIPMLSHNNHFNQQELFSSSIVIMLPICLISLWINTGWDLPWKDALPYLIGGIPGGIAAAYFGRKIPVLWLHRCLGALILYGGIRYLC